MKYAATAIAIVVAICLVAVLALREPPLAADVYPAESLHVGKTRREFRLVVPHDVSTPTPVVFAFHGLGDSTESMAEYSNLDRLAAQHGFILVYPAGQNAMWTTHVDLDDSSINWDVAFFDWVLDHLSGKYQIDRRRVYVVGMSNGAAFVHVMMAIRSGTVTAFVAHSGSKPPRLPAPHFQRPIMLIAGEEDGAALTSKQDAEEYQRNGHKVQLVLVPHLGHEWSAAHNESMWQFLSQYRLQLTSREMQSE